MSLQAPTAAGLEASAQSLRQQFVDRFGAEPRIFQAPGRLNVIGEHIDYCGGRVLPAAIDRRIYVAIAPNDSPRLDAATSLGAGQIELDTFRPCADWRDHVAGAAFALRDAGIEPRGADLLIGGDLPIGSGVSSSAALAVATLLALCAANETPPPDGRTLARIAQSSENRYVGTPSGIMDPFASLHGRRDHALHLDCSTLEFATIRVPSDARFLLIDSGVKHALVDGEYAARRADCETAAQLLRVPVLARAPDLRRVATQLEGRVQRRARHVVTETARVSSAAEALRSNDLARLGALMNVSHASLRDDMEVSTPEVDMLASFAQRTPGVHGARIMGGGFGGAVVALSDALVADQALRQIVASYSNWLGRPVSGFVASLCDGAGEIA